MYLVTPQGLLREGALALLRQHSVPGGKAHDMAVGRDGRGHHRLKGDWIDDARAGIVIVLNRRLVPMAPPRALRSVNAGPPAHINSTYAHDLHVPKKASPARIYVGPCIKAFTGSFSVAGPLPLLMCQDWG